jgi:hypothetical protein
MLHREGTSFLPIGKFEEVEVFLKAGDTAALLRGVHPLDLPEDAVVPEDALVPND